MIYVVFIKNRKWYTIVIVFGRIKDLRKVKRQAQNVICPRCKKKIELGIEYNILKQGNPNIYFPHIHLHGEPLHSLICYINSELKVRNIGVIKSIEISRDSETFSEIMKKWTNPY